eukprot:1161276-Pelagomonas_calceolata.AAC.4
MTALLKPLFKHGAALTVDSLPKLWKATMTALLEPLFKHGAALTVDSLPKLWNTTMTASLKPLFKHGAALTGAHNRRHAHWGHPFRHVAHCANGGAQHRQHAEEGQQLLHGVHCTGVHTTDVTLRAPCMAIPAFLSNMRACAPIAWQQGGYQVYHERALCGGMS